MNRRLRIRCNALALFLFDHHLPIPFLCQIPPDSPCPPSPQSRTCPPTGKDDTLPKVALTTSITPPAQPHGSIPAARTPFLSVPTRPPPRRRRRRPHLPPPPLPPRPRILSPCPKDGRSARPPTGVPTLSTTTAERPPGSTLVSRTRPAPFSPPPTPRPPSISALFPRDGRCA